MDRYGNKAICELEKDDSLGGHHASQLSDGQHIAFFERAGLDERQRLGAHVHLSFGNGQAFGVGFVADVHHAGAAGFIEVGEGGRHRGNYISVPEICYNYNDIRVLPADIGLVYDRKETRPVDGRCGKGKAGAGRGCTCKRNSETTRAREFAQRIAAHSTSKDPEPSNHMGEAEAMALAQRPEFVEGVLLLDELAARAVAVEVGLNISGFAGVLLLTMDEGLLTAEEVKERLERCREQGTHYSADFIERVFQMAKEGAR